MLSLGKANCWLQGFGQKGPGRNIRHADVPGRFFKHRSKSNSMDCSKRGWTVQLLYNHIADGARGTNQRESAV